MKKFNCLIINNEIWLLEARIKYDLKYFDYIILAEADSTFSGLSKPFFYEKYIDLFKAYKDRILYVKIHNLPKPETGNFIGFNDFHSTENCWVVEYEHRNKLQEAILSITKSEDIVCIQDIDEIQNNNYLKSNNSINFTHINFLSYLNFKNSMTNHPKGIWTKAFITNTHNLININIHDYRRIYFNSVPFKIHHISDQSFRFKDSLELVFDAYEAPVQLISKQESHIIKELGWHMSSMTHFIDKRIKWHCFSHQELPNQFMKKKKNTENIFNLELITDNIISNYLDKQSFSELNPLAPSFISESRFISLFTEQYVST
jgi:beta-1,4-mannosyl-glycoprotein beta-1,4-N-acetylglucosaminyltransferase